MNGIVVEVLLGVYLGVLASLFPALIAFSIGFGFKYVTNVTVPGLGVVALGGALAGISGGLMGFVDPDIANNWTGITAVGLILMACLWAHGVGDRLAVATPRRLTLHSIRAHRLSADVLDRVDALGRVRVSVSGEVGDLDGYPPLPESTREAIRSDTWKLPAEKSIAELEAHLRRRLLDSYDLADVAVSLDTAGKATIGAAPPLAGLSRRVSVGERAVSIDTLVPTGLSRGDEVTIRLPDEPVTGRVVSARTDGIPAGSTATEHDDTEETEAGADERRRQVRSAPTTTGGTGRVTIACAPADAERVLAHDHAPIVVSARGSRPEIEAIRLLRRGGRKFRKRTIGTDSPLVGTTVGAATESIESVTVLGIRRGASSIPVPRPDTPFEGGDELLLVGTRPGLDRLDEVIG